MSRPQLSRLADVTSGMGAGIMVTASALLRWWLLAIGLALMAAAIGLHAVEHRLARSGEAR